VVPDQARSPGPEIERVMSEDGTLAVVEKFIAEEALVEDDRRSDE
jgi:hypothetical protein